MNERKRRLEHSRKRRLACEAKVVATPPPRKDAAKEMLKGTGLTLSTPLNDALWLNDADLNERRAVRQAVDNWTRFSGPFDFYHDEQFMATYRGKRMSAADIIREQDLMAFDLLVRGVDVNLIAALTHLTTDEVRAVAERHGIHIE
jgi:hypothetical protein